jgi:hypothetical protein
MSLLGRNAALGRRFCFSAREMQRDAIDRMFRILLAPQCGEHLLDTAADEKPETQAGHAKGN